MTKQQLAVIGRKAKTVVTKCAGVIQFLDVVLASTGESLALVLKTAAGSPLRATLGSAREALFYDAFGSSLEDANVPRCFYAHGDMATGDTTLLMQCLENAVPAGTFFGGEQPNNWGVQERLPELCAGNPPPEDVAADGFKLYARMHACYLYNRQRPRRPAHAVYNRDRMLFITATACYS